MTLDNVFMAVAFVLGGLSYRMVKGTSYEKVLLWCSGAMAAAWFLSWVVK